MAKLFNNAGDKPYPALDGGGVFQRVRGAKPSENLVTHAGLHRAPRDCVEFPRGGSDGKSPR